MTRAAVYLLWLAGGVALGCAVGFALGWLHREAEPCEGCASLRRREAETARVANEAIRALARVQAEVETGDGLAEAEDWRLWSEELREVAE